MPMRKFYVLVCIVLTLVLALTSRLPGSGVWGV